MARYIDADALIEMLNNKAKTDLEMGLYNHHALTESFIRFVERQPTADVVPKSEYDAVVSAVDNSTKEFLKLHDYYQESKSEVERLEGELIVEKTRRKNAVNAYHEARQKVAREIFEEIEKIAKTVGFPEALVNGMIVSHVLDGLYLESVDFHNLKNKYSEEKT